MLTKDNRKFVLELKESLLIMRDKPSLKRKIRFALLFVQYVQLRLIPLSGSSVIGFFSLDSSNYHFFDNDFEVRVVFFVNDLPMARSFFSVIFDKDLSAKNLNNHLNRINNWGFQQKGNFNLDPNM